jgi:murein L,D-transpeptidase YafK
MDEQDRRHSSGLLPSCPSCLSMLEILIPQRGLTMRKAGQAMLLTVLTLVIAAALPADPAPADRIVIVKSTRTMTLMRDGKVVKTYKVALGARPVGAKDRQGDHKTPEGKYFVDAKKNPSLFFLALHLSYPNAADKEKARRLGVSPGGDVEIHGLGKTYGWVGSAHRLHDWTDGCIAVTNEEIEEIFRLVAVGTPVEIRP